MYVRLWLIGQCSLIYSNSNNLRANVVFLTLFWSGKWYPLVSGSTRLFTFESHACRKFWPQSFIIIQSLLIQHFFVGPCQVTPPQFNMKQQHETRRWFPQLKVSLFSGLFKSIDITCIQLRWISRTGTQSNFQRQCDWWTHRPIPSMAEQQDKPKHVYQKHSNPCGYDKLVTWVSMTQPLFFMRIECESIDISTCT